MLQSPVAVGCAALSKVERYAARVVPASGGVAIAPQRCDPKHLSAANAADASLLHPNPKEYPMTIKVGDKLPAGTLQEFYEVEKDGCAIGPNPVKVDDLTKGKKVALFGLPGAFTPTCSAKHVPSYLANYEKLKAKGIDTIACMSVNDAFVMGAWAKDQKSGDKVRMLADGSADYTKALGLEMDLTARGLGVRCQRFSMLVDDGVVKILNIEAPGKFEVSDAETLLKQLG
jgi:peroxiredoxin